TSDHVSVSRQLVPSRETLAGWPQLLQAQTVEPHFERLVTPRVESQRHTFDNFRQRPLGSPVGIARKWNAYQKPAFAGFAVRRLGVEFALRFDAQRPIRPGKRDDRIAVLPCGNVRIAALYPEREPRFLAQIDGFRRRVAKVDAAAAIGRTDARPQARFPFQLDRAIVGERHRGTRIDPGPLASVAFGADLRAAIDHIDIAPAEAGKRTVGSRDADAVEAGL